MWLAKVECLQIEENYVFWWAHWGAIHVVDAGMIFIFIFEASKCNMSSLSRNLGALIMNSLCLYAPCVKDAMELLDRLDIQVELGLQTECHHCIVIAAIWHRRMTHSRPWPWLSLMRTYESPYELHMNIWVMCPGNHIYTCIRDFEVPHVLRPEIREP